MTISLWLGSAENWRSSNATVAPPIAGLVRWVPPGTVVVVLVARSATTISPHSAKTTRVPDTSDWASSPLLAPGRVTRPLVAKLYGLTVGALWKGRQYVARSPLTWGLMAPSIQVGSIVSTP